MMRKLCCCAVLLAVLMPATAFGYVADLSIEPTFQTAAVGEVVAFDVWLRNISEFGPGGISPLQVPSFVARVDLDFGVLPTGLSFQADASAADGFGENDPPIPTEMDLVFDGSLLDGHTPSVPDLSYRRGSAEGIPIDGGDRMLGTFWVSADSPGPYVLSLNNSATIVYSGLQLTGEVVINSDLEDPFTLNYTDAELLVSEAGGAAVPEPAGLGLLGLLVLAARRKRR